jgi:NADPH:quinone reductase-like Zn-dependent oxidoreductase
MNKEDLTVVGQLMATGKVKAVIDKRYRLTEAAEALGYLENGHARGKVIINFEI